jgi:hypothetical protein
MMMLKLFVLKEKEKRFPHGVHYLCTTVTWLDCGDRSESAMTIDKEFVHIIYVKKDLLVLSLSPSRSQVAASFFF